MSVFWCSLSLKIFRGSARRCLGTLLMCRLMVWTPISWDQRDGQCVVASAGGPRVGGSRSLLQMAPIRLRARPGGHYAESMPSTTRDIGGILRPMRWASTFTPPTGYLPCPSLRNCGTCADAATRFRRSHGTCLWYCISRSIRALGSRSKQTKHEARS